MPLNDFFKYTIKLNKAGHIEASLIIDRNHRIFKGHFPGNPVTPGVVQIEMVRQVLSRCIQKDLMLAEAKDLKYITPILPSHTDGIDLTIDYKKEQTSISAKCLLSRDEIVFTKIRGTFSEL